MKVWISKENNIFFVYSKEPKWITKSSCETCGHNNENEDYNIWTAGANTSNNPDGYGAEFCGDSEKFFPELKKLKNKQCAEFELTLKTVWEPNE